MRIIIGILNGIDFDNRIDDDDDDNIDDYTEELEQNEAYKCYVGRNVYFAQKMLYYTIKFILVGLQEGMDEKYHLPSYVVQYEKIRLINNKILALALNQVCHQSIPTRQVLFQEDLTRLTDKLNKHKIELLNSAPKLLLTVIHNKFYNPLLNNDDEDDEDDEDDDADDDDNDDD